MSYRIKPMASFQRQFKRLYRKYPSLKRDVAELGERLAENPVITYVHVVGETVYLLAVYYKSEKEDLAEGELDQLLSELDD